MQRRSFMKKSVAAAIIAATPLALTGLVNAAGGVGGTNAEAGTGTGTTDWFTNETTDIQTTISADDVCLTNGIERKFTYSGKLVCATMMTCGAHWEKKEYRSPMRECIVNGIDQCPGFPERIELSGQGAADFGNRVVCNPTYLS